MLGLWYVNTLNIELICKLNDTMKPRTLEIEHFLGIDGDVLQDSVAVPTIYVYDPNNPYRVARSMPIADHLEPTPAFPTVSFYLHKP